MTEFKPGDRVRVTTTAGMGLTDENGVAGTVVSRVYGPFGSVKRHQGGGWNLMIALDRRDDALGEFVHPFPADDERRRTWVVCTEGEVDVEPPTPARGAP